MLPHATGLHTAEAALMAMLTILWAVVMLGLLMLLINMLLRLH